MVEFIKAKLKMSVFLVIHPYGFDVETGPNRGQNAVLQRQVLNGEFVLVRSSIWSFSQFYRFDWIRLKRLNCKYEIEPEVEI